MDGTVPLDTVFDGKPPTEPNNIPYQSRLFVILVETCSYTTTTAACQLMAVSTSGTPHMHF